MAKRKRLSPAPMVQGDPVEKTRAPGHTPGDTPDRNQTPAPDGPSGPGHDGLRQGLVPPIARVGAETAAHAALTEIGAELEAARASGRLAIDIPVAAVVVDHLIRDRLDLDDAALSVLMQSLQDRGQQTPIDVTDLGGGRYGLISGYRRLQAMARLRDRHPDAADRWQTVRAVLRRPDTAGDAYRAMVEENEIRVGLTYFERARIVAACVAAGIFPDTTEALRTLFRTASRARRSKIGSFLPIVAALDGVLRHPDALPERLGLAVAKVLQEDADFGPTLAGRLHSARLDADRSDAGESGTGGSGGPRTVEAERTIIESTLADHRLRERGTRGPDMTPDTPPDMPPGASAARTVRLTDGLVLTARDGVIVIEGPAVDPALRDSLIAWLRAR